ncbi:MAG: hypothetical protein ACI9K3_000216, partial [Halovenus sp.]
TTEPVRQLTLGRPVADARQQVPGDGGECR